MKKICIIILGLLMSMTLLGESSFEYYQKGEEALQNNNYQEALLFYKKSLEKNPYFSKALFQVAKINLQLNHDKEAELYLNKFMKVSPRDIEGINLLGNLFLGRRNLKKAASYFAKAKNIDPLNYDTQLGLAQVLIEEKNYDAAKRILNQLIKINEKREEAYLAYINIYLLQNKVNRTEPYLEKAEYYNPGSYSVFYYKGLIEKKKNNFLQAKKYFERSYSLNKENYNTLINLIDVYFNLKEWNKAIDFLKQVIDTFPHESIFYNELGLAYQLNQDYDKAIENFLKSYEINSVDDIVRYHLENVLVKKKPYYNDDRKIFADIHFSLAQKYNESFQPYDAFYEYKRGLYIQSENGEQRNNLGLLYKKNNLLEKYLKELEIASLLEPDNQLYKDRLEKAKTFKNTKLAHQLNIDQYQIKKDRIRIYIAPFKRENNQYIHQQTGVVISDSISSHLKLYNTFEPLYLDGDKTDYYFNLNRNEIKKRAIQNKADFYLDGNFTEKNDFLSADFFIYSVEFDEPLGHFLVFGKGRDKLFLLSSEASKELNNFLPTTGTIIKIRDKEIIVNLGIDDRIQRGDRLEIYNKGSLNKNLTLEQYSKIEPKIIGYAKIKNSDEQISLAELEKPMYVDQVSVNYTVKVVKEKKKPQPKK